MHKRTPQFLSVLPFCWTTPLVGGVALFIVGCSIASSDEQLACNVRILNFHHDVSRLEPPPESWETEYGETLMDIFHANGLDGLKSECNSDPENLKELFRATRTVAFYNPDSDHVVEQLLFLHEALEDLGFDDNQRLLRTHQALVANRRFNSANRLAERSGKIHTIHFGGSYVPDDPNSSSKREVLRLRTESNSVEVQQIDLCQNRHFVILFDSECHFSVSMLAEIFHDSKLLDALKGRATLLYPQGSRLDPTAMRTWMENQPIPVFWMWREQSWPELNSRLTPTVYVFQDGELIDTISGAGDESLGRIRDLLR